MNDCLSLILVSSLPSLSLSLSLSFPLTPSLFFPSILPRHLHRGLFPWSRVEKRKHWTNREVKERTEREWMCVHQEVKGGETGEESCIFRIELKLEAKRREILQERERRSFIMNLRVLPPFSLQDYDCYSFSCYSNICGTFFRGFMIRLCGRFFRPESGKKWSVSIHSLSSSTQLRLSLLPSFRRLSSWKFRIQINWLKDVYSRKRKNSYCYLNLTMF